nr:hypothetical protein CFP56_07350 [Quercus suber]
MSGDNEATSERTSLICMGSNDNLFSPRLEYYSDDSLVFDRSSSLESSLGEASPSGRRPREVIFLDDWFIHDFPVNMSDKVFAKACLTILLKQEAFLERVFEIPFEERPWKKLVNLDMLHTYCVHFLTYPSVSEMESSKNKQAAKNRQEEIKKVVALRAQGKGTGGPSICLEVREVAADAPCQRVGKGLMTSQGHVIPSPLPLLMKDKEHVVDIARFIVRDADLDECSKHETDPLGDSGLHDMIRVSLFISPLAVESSFYFDRLFLLRAWLTALTTPAVELTLEDVETNEEVVVTDGPGRVIDDPVNPLVQSDDPPISP